MLEKSRKLRIKGLQYALCTVIAVLSVWGDFHYLPPGGPLYVQLWSYAWASVSVISGIGCAIFTWKYFYAAWMWST